MDPTTSLRPRPRPVAPAPHATSDRRPPHADGGASPPTSPRSATSPRCGSHGRHPGRRAAGRRDPPGVGHLLRRLSGAWHAADSCAGSTSPPPVDKLLFDELRESDVLMTNARAGVDGPIAEYVLACVMAHDNDSTRPRPCDAPGGATPRDHPGGRPPGADRGDRRIGRATARLLRASGSTCGGRATTPRPRRGLRRRGGFRASGRSSGRGGPPGHGRAADGRHPGDARCAGTGGTARRRPRDQRRSRRTRRSTGADRRDRRRQTLRASGRRRRRTPPRRRPALAARRSTHQPPHVR